MARPRPAAMSAVSTLTRLVGGRPPADPYHGPGQRCAEGAIAASVRQHDVEHLLSVARLLDVGDLAAAAVGNAQLGDLVVRDGVLGRDVLRTDDAGDVDVADLEVDPDLLPAVDHQVAVR